MYVCVCNAVTDRDIGHAVADGCCSMKELRDRLGVGDCCGRCTGCARDVLHQSLHAGAPHRLTVTGQVPVAA